MIIIVHMCFYHKKVFISGPGNLIMNLVIDEVQKIEDPCDK